MSGRRCVIIRPHLGRGLWRMWGMPGKQSPTSNTTLYRFWTRHAIPMRKLNDPAWPRPLDHSCWCVRWHCAPYRGHATPWNRAGSAQEAWMVCETHAVRITQDTEAVWATLLLLGGTRETTDILPALGLVVVAIGVT